MSALSKTVFSGTTYGVMGMGTEGGATPYRITVAANGGWGGSRINIDVLNAEQQLYTAERDWHRARAETLMQGLRLKAANATLAEADLSAINNMLETGQQP